MSKRRRSRIRPELNHLIDLDHIVHKVEREQKQHINKVVIHQDEEDIRHFINDEYRNNEKEQNYNIINPVLPVSTRPVFYPFTDNFNTRRKRVTKCRRNKAIRRNLAIKAQGKGVKLKRNTKRKFKRCI